MLCGSFESLNGAHVSDFPVRRSKRCTPANPLFCAHTLPSTPEFQGDTWCNCVDDRLSSGGGLKYWNCSLAGSNLTIAAWYMLPSQSLPSRSPRRASTPTGYSGLEIAMSYSFTAPESGSTRPIFWSPNAEYQIVPLASRMTSCGCASLRGRSYSV